MHTYLSKSPENRSEWKNEVYTFLELGFIPRVWNYETCCLSPAEGGISDALLILEWLIAPALSTPMPSMPDVFESHPEALNSPYVLYSELKSLTLYSLHEKALMFPEYVFARYFWSHVCLSSYCNCSLCWITMYKTAVLILTSQLTSVEVAVMSKMKRY